jgi:nicotinate-nucleotide adenylyltransferase
MRLGILGGSFDPVHFGHLLLAECCRETCSLDRIWFVPAGIPPHKQARQLADAKDRIEMLRLGIAGNDALDVSLVEVERGGVSYTVETLRCITRSQPEADLFLLMGADTLADLPTWREPGIICDMATLAVVSREPATIDWTPVAAIVSPERLGVFQQHVVLMPRVEFSSTAIRAAVAAGRSIRYRTPRAVEKYIETHGLYRNS